MTRINVVPPSELCDAHLGAEYRELPRVFPLVRRAIARGELPTDPRNPARYVLGRGHVRFFYPRLGWLAARYDEIVAECRRRGRRVTYPNIFGSDIPAEWDRWWRPIPAEWWGWWRPDEEALALNRTRIAERLSKMNEMTLRKSLTFDPALPSETNLAQNSFTLIEACSTGELE